MSKLKKSLIILFVMVGLSSCEVLNQVAQMANFANCKFNFNSVDQIQMLGVNLHKGMTKSDLNITQLAQLTTSILSKKLPVTFNVNVGVNNPNSIAAAMAKMDYIITLNGKEVISTTSMFPPTAIASSQFPSPPTSSSSSVVRRPTPS